MAEKRSEAGFSGVVAVAGVLRVRVRGLIT